MVSVERDLEGRTAVVTGSGRNIGRAIALELAAKGANLVLNARTNIDEVREVERSVRARGVDTVVVMGDVSAPATVDEMRRRSEERFGGVDILVSNAAVRPHQPFLDIDEQAWGVVLDTQLTASFRLARAFVPGMIARGWGRIIHITGPDAFLGLPDRAHNVTAKAAIRGLTKALAVELGPHGITVNDVAPGAIDTVRNEASHPGMPHARNDRSKLVDQIPVRRLGTPEDVAYACGFLASPRAGFYTGTVLCCFGGQWNVG